MNVCKFCDKTFSSKSNLNRHISSCKIKENFDIQEQIRIQLQNRHKIEIDSFHEKLQNQQNQYENLIQKFEEQQQQYETKIQILDQKINEQKEQIEKLELQNLEYHNQIFEIAKQPKQQQITNNNSQTTNNRILNITNHLIPIETDEEIRKMIDNQYTRDIFLGGSDSLKDMTVSILKDQETGKYRTVCSDASRSVFYYLDNENNLIKDIGMKNIHKKIQKPLFAATSLHYKEIDRDGSIDDDKLCEIFSDNINFIDHELPTRLKPELQIPVNLSQNLIK
jgi:hypothetical protein